MSRDVLWDHRDKRPANSGMQPKRKEPRAADADRLGPGRQRRKMSSDDTPKYWFSAKRYLLGGGAYLAHGRMAGVTRLPSLDYGGIPMVHATKGSVIYIIYVSAVSAALTAICWLTGEPTRWRW